MSLYICSETKWSLFLIAPPPFKKKKYSHLGKNPNVDTSFLPDRDREVCEMCEKYVMCVSVIYVQCVTVKCVICGDCDVSGWGGV